jgi:NAD(P)H-flavin reductase
MIASETNPWLSHPVVIDRITAEAPGVDTYHLRFADAAHEAAFGFRPGQFSMLYLPGCGEAAISISGNPAARDGWAYTIRVAGNATAALKRLGAGGSLGLRGPYGTHWPLEQCEGADVVLVAGGLGMAPLRPAVYQLLAEPSLFGRVTLLFGARAPDELLFAREFSAWHAGSFHVQTTVDRCEMGWHGNVGTAPLLFERLRWLNPANTVLLVCGPEVMMHYTIRAALQRGLQKERIWLSMERNMQCAVGLCGHCQLGPAFICKDGPVFRYDQIEPFLQVQYL